MIRHAESGARVLRSVCHKLNSGWSAGIALVVVFVVTRILILQSAVTCPVDGDIQYYAGSFALSAASGTSPLKEYPTPVVWILEAIYRLGGGDGWAPVYVACFMALDALVALSLFRRRNAAGAWFWILFTGALGSTLYFRYDLIPAALVAWACLLVISHPAVAGGLLALGAAVKLWPALLMAPMLTPLRRRGAGWLRLAGFVVVGVAMVVAALLFGGWKRLLTPLTYQTDRGLQIESLPATLPMLLRAVDPSGGWEVGLSKFHAYEITGWGVRTMLGVSDAFTALSFILVAVLTVRMLVTLRRAEKQRTAEAILLTVLAVTLVIIIANKTLSPQYIVWLGGPVAALQVLRTSRWLRPHAWGLAVGLLVVAVLTQATYPWNYGAIRAGQLPATLILVSRNLLVVVIFCYTTGLAWVAARRPMARPVRRPEEAVAAA